MNPLGFAVGLLYFRARVVVLDSFTAEPSIKTTVYVLPPAVTEYEVDFIARVQLPLSH